MTVVMTVVVVVVVIVVNGVVQLFRCCSFFKLGDGFNLLWCES